jgi:multicomponent Na+:H+ antiporter subunit G
MLQTDGQILVLVKLILIFLFILITSPTASHALAKAALHGGLRPKLGSKQDEQDDDVLERFGFSKSESKSESKSAKDNNKE